MNVSNNTVSVVGLRQPPKTSNTTRRSTPTGKEPKKLANYIQQELAQLAERERNYNLLEELPALLKLRCSPRLPLKNAEELHNSLDKAIDFFNANAVGYQKYAGDIQSLKNLRAKFKTLIDKLKQQAESLDEAA